MILPAAVALGATLIVPIAARGGGGVPVLNVEPVCQGIAQQGGASFHDPSIARERQNCLDSEKEVRDQLVRQWSSFSAGDRSACVQEATMGGDSSYTELLTCLEMARDVRALRSEQNRPAPPPPPPPAASPPPAAATAPAQAAPASLAPAPAPAPAQTPGR